MEIYLHHHIGQTHSFQWLGSSPVRDLPLFIRFLSYPFSVPQTMYLKTGLESISCSGHVSPVGGSISNLEKASWWQPVTICTFLSPLGVCGGCFCVCQSPSRHGGSEGQRGVEREWEVGHIGGKCVDWTSRSRTSRSCAVGISRSMMLLALFKSR